MCPLIVRVMPHTTVSVKLLMRPFYVIKSTLINSVFTYGLTVFFLSTTAISPDNREISHLYSD
jgi:hypothetical protein